LGALFAGKGTSCPRMPGAAGSELPTNMSTPLSRRGRSSIT
jgi:hypothetical protein